MAKFSKSILLEDRDYHSPDGIVSVSPTRKKYWADKVAEFSSNKFGIPVFWDHQADLEKSKPVQLSGSKRRTAKDQAGWLVGASLDDKGGLKLDFDIPGKADSAKVKDNVTKVSPVFWEKIKDGRGQEHQNVIGACDLVVHPVDDTQTDFEPAIACSLVRMSLDGPKIVRFAEDEEEKPKKEPPKLPEPKEELGDELKDEPEPEEEPDSSDDQEARVQRVVEALASMSVVLSEDTNSQNLLEHLEQALLTAAAIGEDQMGTENLEAATPQMQLSLNSPHAKYIDKQHRSMVGQRLSAILESGKCTPAEYQDKSAGLKTVRLSLDREGNHIASGLEEWIASREAVPKGTFWDSETRTQKMALEPAEQPEHARLGPMSREEAREQARKILTRGK